MDDPDNEVEIGIHRTPSERWILLLLAAVQFTHIVDFMVMMPLGPQLMRELDIGPGQFSALISAFAISAGVVGLLAAPFIDRFDRKRLLLFCYAGFALATLLCGLMETAAGMMLARALCGAFGGVSTATIMAIIADIVPPERRARGMGVVMVAFAVASSLGVPLGLIMAQAWRWEAPFLGVFVIAAVNWVLLRKSLPPVRGHLSGMPSSFSDFVVLLKDRNAWMGLLLIVMTVFGHFTIIPLLSTFFVGNVDLPEAHLVYVYIVGGIASILTAPKLGRLADRWGHAKVYSILVVVASVIIWNLTNSGPRSGWQVFGLVGCFFAFASGRFIPAQAAVSMAVPSARRGAYMSLIGCSREIASAVTAALGGVVVTQLPDGSLVGFDKLGWIAIGVGFASLFVIRKIRAVS